MSEPYKITAIISAHDVDLHVGRRIRMRGALFGLSQVTIADELGVSHQQVQKYELAKNRISAGKLWLIAEILDVPISFFFDEMTSAKSNFQLRSIA